MKRLNIILGMLLVALVTTCCASYKPEFRPISEDYSQGKIHIEILDGTTCLLRNDDDNGIVHYFPCELLKTNAETILKYIEICDSFYDDACEGYDI